MSQHFGPSDKATLPPALSSKVVGLTFQADYPDNLHDLNDSPHPFALQLVREPKNPHDRNAVAVRVVAGAEQLGHLPAALAARIAPEMDSGRRWVIGAWEVLIMPGHEHQPGLTVRLSREEGGA